MRNMGPGSEKSKSKWVNLAWSATLKNLSYVFFVAMLCMVYIANTHYAEKNLRKSNQLEKRLREAKWELMSLKSDINHQSTRSEIGRKLEGYEKLEDQKLPKKIEISKS